MAASSSESSSIEDTKHKYQTILHSANKTPVQNPTTHQHCHPTPHTPCPSPRKVKGSNQSSLAPCHAHTHTRTHSRTPLMTQHIELSSIHEGSRATDAHAAQHPCSAPMPPPAHAGQPQDRAAAALLVGRHRVLWAKRNPARGQIRCPPKASQPISSDNGKSTGSQLLGRRASTSRVCTCCRVLSTSLAS
jgi:hypothetical protein